MINRIISFKQIPLKNCNGYKIPVTATFQNDQNTYLAINNKSKNKNSFHSAIMTEKALLAENNFIFAPNTKIIFNGSMDVWDETKRRKFRYGTKMHLANIIMMLENNMKEIKLYSLGDAVFFHAKCGFKPRFADSVEAYYCLKEIGSKDTPFIFDYQKKSENLYKMLLKNNDEKTLQAIEKLTNRYINDILESNLYKDKSFGFKKGFSMSLKKTDVLRNKEFYNDLFKQCGIDYKIA